MQNIFFVHNFCLLRLLWKLMLRKLAKNKSKSNSHTWSLFCSFLHIVPNPKKVYFIAFVSIKPNFKNCQNSFYQFPTPHIVLYKCTFNITIYNNNFILYIRSCCNCIYTFFKYCLKSN